MGGGLFSRISPPYFFTSVCVLIFVLVLSTKTTTQMKTQIALAISLLLLVGCSQNDNVEPKTPADGVDYFKFQYDSQWTLIEAQPDVVQEPPIDCDPKIVMTVKSVSMSQKTAEGQTRTIGFEFIGHFTVVQLGSYPLTFSRTDVLPGVEVSLQEPKDGYKTYKTTNTLQPSDSFFEITDIKTQITTQQLSGEFMAMLNNGEKINGSFRMTVPKPTIN